MGTLIILISSLVTDMALGALAYKVAKAQEQSVRALEKIADNLDRRVSILERDSSR